MEHTANVLNGKPFRGFESLPLRKTKSARMSCALCMRKQDKEFLVYILVDSNVFTIAPF